MTQVEDNTPHDEVAEVVRAVGRRPAPPADAYDQVLTATTAAWERTVKRRRRRATWSRLAAAVAVVAVGLGVWLSVGGGLSSAPVATVAGSQGDARRWVDDSWRALGLADTIVGRTDLQTGNSGVIALQLSTGVQLRVAADTQLRLMSANDIELKAGRIYIDSDRFSLGGDLRLVTPFGEVRDIGTQFQVDVDATRLRVRIREGQVVVARAGLRVDGGVGEQIQVDTAGRVDRTAFPTHGSEWGWAEALAAPFGGGSLKDFLVWIARETGYVLEFDDSGTERLAGTVKVSGNTEGFTLAEALEAQKPTAPSFDTTYVMA